ncbi:uncharacterized protein LOC106527993 [Austrofundulus limnaeus]|uniref:Uncharacterized protein LOC106527993 n=1 Tax=Austrofundulus limnaeus TaxID=52670 RepID=A0A2I4CER5_AUSLI|nr:PREDICTED: uncharacterized protein LOC106527993 [Austrofundulus limnaeus]
MILSLSACSWPSSCSCLPCPAHCLCPSRHRNPNQLIHVTCSCQYISQFQPPAHCQIFISSSMIFQRSCSLSCSCLMSPTLLMSPGLTSPASALVGSCLSSALTVTTLFLSLGLLPLAFPLHDTSPHRTSWISTTERISGPTAQPAPSNLVTISDHPCMTLDLLLTLSKPHSSNTSTYNTTRNQNTVAVVSTRTQSLLRRLVYYIILFNNIILLCQPNFPSLCADLLLPESHSRPPIANSNNKLVKPLSVFGTNSELTHPIITMSVHYSVEEALELIFSDVQQDHSDSEKEVEMYPKKKMGKITTQSMMNRLRKRRKP